VDWAYRLAQHLGPIAVGLEIFHRHVFAIDFAGNEEGERLAVDLPSVHERRLVKPAPRDGDGLAPQHVTIGPGQHVERIGPGLAVELDTHDKIVIVYGGPGAFDRRDAARYKLASVHGKIRMCARTSGSDS
jgi:hypothetical protein